MNLSPPQAKKLYEALKDAFPTDPTLEMMVFFVFGNEVLSEINENNVADSAFRLIQWAVSHNQVEQLVLGARSENKSNQYLIDISLEMGLEGSTAIPKVSFHKSQLIEFPPPVSRVDNKPQALHSLNDEQCCAVEACSHLRFIELKIFETILLAAYPKLFGTYTSPQFTQLKQSIEEAKIFTSYDNQKHLVVKQDLRSHFQYEAREINSEMKERARKVHYAALEQYRLLLLRNLPDRYNLILDELYHCAFLKQLGETHFDLVELFDLRLSSFPNSERNDEAGWIFTLQNFQNTIEHEPEIKDLLDQITLDRLNEVIVDHMT